MTKQYDPENFLIRSEEMTDEQSEVLKSYLAGFHKHEDISVSYYSTNSNVLSKNVWRFRGLSKGSAVYADKFDWCGLEKNKPPIITFKEFEENILNASKETQTTFPDFDFKISCGDQPEVRQWLKGNGVKWYGGEDVTDHLVGMKFLQCKDGTISWNNEDYYNKDTLPELTPTFGVTGWTVEQKDSEEKLALQESISKMEQELEQMKQRVKEIK